MKARILEPLREALGEVFRRYRLMLLKGRLDDIKHVLDKIDVDEVTRFIREDRESR